MKNMMVLAVLLIAGLSAAQQSGAVMDVGESLMVGGPEQNEANDLLEQAEDEINAGESQGKNMDQARTHYEIAQRAYDEGDYEAAKVHAQEAVNAAVQAGAYAGDDTGQGQQAQVHTQTQAGNGSGEGISAQVHAIIQERKGGTLDVPQGQVVRIIAQNRVIEVENETIPLNATLRIRLNVQEHEHILAFNGSGNEIEVEEQGVKVRTRENLMISNNQIIAGNANITVLPGGLQEKLMMEKMEHARLHVENGTPYYQVNGTKAGKMLWVFDVDVPVQAQIHAQSGAVVSQQGPWWAFLVTSES